MNCKICSRQADEDGFCRFHLRAYRNIVNKFSVWQDALGVSWKKYIVEIQKNSLTGIWAKDVAKHLIKEEQIDV